MPKLQVNEDGTVTIPVKGREPVVLDEPTMADLAWLTDEAGKIDAGLTDVPTLRVETATAEQIEAFNTASNARNTEIYSGAMPYGELLIEVIKRFSDGTETVDATQLYGWAASPRVIRTLLEHFRAPLPGAE